MAYVSLRVMPQVLNRQRCSPAPIWLLMRAPAVVAKALITMISRAEILRTMLVTASGRSPDVQSPGKNKPDGDGNKRLHHGPSGNGQHSLQQMGAECECPAETVLPFVRRHACVDDEKRRETASDTLEAMAAPAMPAAESRLSQK